MKKILLSIIISALFIIPVSAAETQEEFYRQQYELSGADEISDYLPEDTEEYLQKKGIDLENEDWISAVTPENVFMHIFSFLKSGAKLPFAAGAVILAVILISATLTANEIGGSNSAVALYAAVVALVAAIAAPVFSVITASVDAMKGCAVFMISFVPIFAVIVASAGGAATSISMSTLLLGAAQAVNYVSNFIVMPLMSGYLAISLSSSVSPIISKSGIADGIKRLAFWIMSLISTVFIGVLSIQTAVSASADSLSVRTAKFIVGSAVPVAGTALSEALTTVTASMGMLRTTVGIYAVIASATIFLPLLAELLLWRLVLTLTSCVADLFSVSKISSLLKSVDAAMSVLIGIILLTAAMFIISLTVVITVGKT